MSTLPTDDSAAATPPEFLDALIIPRSRDLGGFEVRRALPSAQRRMVGPFVFWDQMGPVKFESGHGIDVRPHPHIGLATVTYLFEGAIHHRDSLGNAQSIEPGAINWMTAGKGIVHSERTSPAVRASGGRLAGIQSWVALPKDHEETAPSFFHHPKDSLPAISGEGKQVRLLVGSAFGARSPVATFSETLYADAILAPGAALPFAADMIERAIYVIDGDIEIADRSFGPSQLLVLRPGDEITVRAPQGARFLMFGGEPLDGPRHLWWNFVSSSQERIEQAKADWKAARFAPMPGDDAEFIPLPE